ncbi:UV excision repair protein RAD23 homolog A-like [Lineus longissimus]|uniref:UV excision repair protein RAD23 homolog A-like n=1 Tax=Lineus longissimus TaxID=88925 RepID=UPI002B4CFFE2
MSITITLKTLQQQSFTVEIDESETVKKLKEKIEEVKGADNFPVGGQKLIYAGKILEDEKTVKDCNIEASNFIVVMVTKPKAAPSKPAESKPAEVAAPAAAAAPAAPTQPAEKKEEAKDEKKEEASAASTPAATAMDTTPSTTASTATTEPAEPLDEASNRLATGSQYEKAVTGLVEMGFPRELVMRAMSQAFNCPDRAAEYLLSNTVRDEPVAAPPATPPQGTGPRPGAPTGAAPLRQPVQATAAGNPAAPAGGSTGTAAGEENPLAFLRDQPHFRRMCEMVQSEPRQLPEFLQQIGQDNPDLLRLINENQQTFVNMLNEPHEGHGGGGVGGGAVPNLPATIQITPDDKAAIDKLKAMGFNEMNCIQAYFACDKDEQAAANFLMEEMLDDEESNS